MKSFLKALQVNQHDFHGLIITSDHCEQEQMFNIDIKTHYCSAQARAAIKIEKDFLFGE